MTTNNYKHIAIEEDVYYIIKEQALKQKKLIKDYIRELVQKENKENE